VQKILFAIEWEFEDIGSSSQGVIHYLHNSEIGDFYITPLSIMQIEEIPRHIFLAKINESKYDNRKYIICLDNEKESFTRRDAYLLTKEQIAEQYPDNIIDKQSAIIFKLYTINKKIGGRINFERSQPFMYYSESIKEMLFLLDLLIQKNIISCGYQYNEREDTFIPLEPIIIQENGWMIIEEKLKSEESNHVFVAMWFDEKMNRSYTMLEDLLVEMGFTPIRIDKKEHNNEISGEILYEIRKCKFLISDVTGQRPGVYFEAGYAMGLNIPVIWSCHAEEIQKVHFDTRQYNHVVWSNEEELREKMLHRIKGTIL
jgi:nucleoside 2-deoxyribosyltransferase